MSGPEFLDRGKDNKVSVTKAGMEAALKVTAGNKEATDCLIQRYFAKHPDLGGPTRTYFDAHKSAFEQRLRQDFDANKHELKNSCKFSKGAEENISRLMSKQTAEENQKFNASVASAQDQVLTPTSKPPAEVQGKSLEELEPRLTYLKSKK